MATPLPTSPPSRLLPPLLLFVVLLSVHTLVIASRKPLTATLPFMLDDDSLFDFTKESAGVLTSVFAVGVICARFPAGMASDIYPPKWLLVGGLIGTGLSNIGMSRTVSPPLMTALYFLLGIAQSFCWPAVARLLYLAFPAKTRGTYWSGVTTGDSIALFVAGVGGSRVAAASGWRDVFLLSGTLCFTAAALVFALPLPTNPVKTSSTTTTSSSAATPVSSRTRKKSSTKSPHSPQTPDDAPDSNDGDVPPVTLLSEMLSPRVLSLVLLNFFIYVARSGSLDWMPLYLIEERGFTSAEVELVAMSTAIGALLGSLLSGVASDYLFRGRRTPVLVICALGCCLSALALATPLSPSLMLVAVFVFQFSVHGPFSLIGLAIMENANRSISGQVSAAVSLISTFGKVLAGYPTTMLITTYGWSSLPTLLVVCSGLAMLMSLSLK